MAQQPQLAAKGGSQPAFQAEAERCALQMSELDAEAIAQLLHINPQLAALNKQRYHDFLDLEPRTPAVLAYTGMAYRHLRASEWNETELATAQERLLITSFLYGLNRPLDLIKDYRMEGKLVLPDHDGQTMFQFWRPLLTPFLLERVAATGGVLINLASAEMKQLFDWRRVEREAEVITPEFLVDKAGGLKTVVVYAKMMRGAMTRHLIQHPEAPLDDLKAFTYEGFTYRPELSDAHRWVWVLG